MTVGKVIRVAIADHYCILRDALCHLLKSHRQIQVVGEAEDGFGAMELAARGDVDVLILEPEIPKKDGLELIKDIVKSGSKTRILILTVDPTHHYAFRLLRAGAKGWLPKTAPLSEVAEAIRKVDRGEVFLTKELQQSFAERYVNPQEFDSFEKPLTDREYAVFKRLAEGMNNRQIAKELFIVVKTVDTHRASILDKLRLKNNTELARYAIRYGLVKFKIETNRHDSRDEDE